MSDVLSAPELLERISTEFGDRLVESNHIERTFALGKRTAHELWFRVDKDDVRPLVEFLTEISYLHISLTSPIHYPDEGYVQLNYHWTIFWDTPGAEISIIITANLPMDDLTMPTMTDIYPGIIVTEREEKEMMGLTIEGLPDPRHMFLPRDFPDDVHPWRKEPDMDKRIKDGYKQAFAGVPDDDVDNQEGST